MGSIPSEDALRELEREAYVSILRAVYARPHQDYFALEDFLDVARKQLNVSLDLHSGLLKGVRTEIELIRQGKPLPDSVRKGGYALASIPPGKTAIAVSPRDDYDVDFDPHADTIRTTKRTRSAKQQKQAQTKRKAATPSQQSPESKKKAKPAATAVTRPIGAPGGSRARGRPQAPKANRQSGGGNSLQRSRSTRSNADPNGYLNRIIWRYYPNEDEERPWVEGFLIDYDPDTRQYTILYDPNGKDTETTEVGFDFTLANPDEYVLGEHFGHLSEHNGSQRRPHPPPPVTIPPPTAQLTSAPSKRRRSSVKLPHSAPFPVSWFETAVADATLDDLKSMLSMLEHKEIDLCMSIENLDRDMAMGEDLDKRAELEKKFEDLCKRESEIMAELAGLAREQ